MAPTAMDVVAFSPRPCPATTAECPVAIPAVIRAAATVVVTPAAIQAVATPAAAILVVATPVVDIPVAAIPEVVCRTRCR